MPVRRTEAAIPFGRDPAVLGQAVAVDGRSALISYCSTPIRQGRANTYVVFVTDTTIATGTETFEWAFDWGEDGQAGWSTYHGQITFEPDRTGSLAVSVRLLAADGAELSQISLQQEVIEEDGSLEMDLLNASSDNWPSMGDSDVARELVNDLGHYCTSSALAVPDADDAFVTFVRRVLADGLLRHPHMERELAISAMADALNDDEAGATDLLPIALGVGDLRLTLLAMTMTPGGEGSSPLLEWTELSSGNAQYGAELELLQQQYASLPLARRIDLFNIARFPRSNIRYSAMAIRTLWKRYFPSVSFSDLVMRFEGLRADRLFQHFRIGPLKGE